MVPKVVSAFFSNPGPPEADGARPSPEANAGISLKWRSCGRSTVGKVRELNEDAFLENPESGVWAVADGMGGHSAGDEASKAVVDALGSISGSDTLEALTADVTACLQKTNADLIRLCPRKENTVKSWAARWLSCWLPVNQCAAIWAGDSRLYRCRNGLLSQLTRDHALVPEMVPQDPASPDALADKTAQQCRYQGFGRRSGIGRRCHDLRGEAGGHLFAVQRRLDQRGQAPGSC